MRAHSRGWGSRRPAHSARLRPPKCRRLSRLVRLPNRCPDPACGAVAAAGGPRVSALPASRHACGPSPGRTGRRLRAGRRDRVREHLPARRGHAARPSFRGIGATIRLRPQIRRDDPLNLSILLSGGKETNQDSLSSGERRGKSPAPNPRPTGGRGKCGVRKTACPVSLGGLSPSDRGSARGRCEAGNGPRRAGVRSSRSRVVWECSPKRVVNSI